MEPRVTVDRPGALSSAGARHDNDHAEIPSINILPTFQEIMSQRGEYLPTTGPTEWHIGGIHGRLDREFRLLREDAVKPIRDTLREVLSNIPGHGNTGPHRVARDVRAYVYDRPVLTKVNFNRKAGFELTIRCRQSNELRHKEKEQPEKPWSKGDRQQFGSLACIIDESGLIFYCVIGNQEDVPSNEVVVADAREGHGAPQPDVPGLNDVYMLAKPLPESSRRRKCNDAIPWLQNPASRQMLCLVEFRDVFLDSFLPTLRILQHVYIDHDLPFSHLIAPQEIPAHSKLRPPAYARYPGFKFDLTCITHDDNEFVVLPSSPPMPAELGSRSALDVSQSAALLNTLCREVSLIHGPPGTGKSHVGRNIVKVLLANKMSANLGPILCVSYTNHALDQFLEQLLDEGIRRITRIGSRSKSERLRKSNFQCVAEHTHRTYSENLTIRQLENSIATITNEINQHLARLEKVGSWTSIKNMLASKFPRQHDRLFGVPRGAQDDITAAKIEEIGWKWLKSGCHTPTMRQTTTLLYIDPTTMTHDERKELYQLWSRIVRDPIERVIVKLLENYHDAQLDRDWARDGVRLRNLQLAEVVGVTTTGIAKNRTLLERVGFKVMLIEEASEVLEAHMLAALLPSIEHWIMMGDHQQLRPRTQSHNPQSMSSAAKADALYTSLFERFMVQPSHRGVGLCNTLDTQRRMHPALADLARYTAYPFLRDSDIVQSFPSVSGMRERLFWFHHKYHESSAMGRGLCGSSHYNDFEAKIAVGLASYLARLPDFCKFGITILTPYRHQLERIARHVSTVMTPHRPDPQTEQPHSRNDNRSSARPTPVRPSSPTMIGPVVGKIRLSTVDDYQGEENTVVILSLVRSNPQRDCGFLRNPNRINVLISRAKHGLYFIGNVETYKDVPTWAKVISLLQSRGQFGDQLQLLCTHNPEAYHSIAMPEDFDRCSSSCGTGQDLWMEGGLA